jgi:hypothetical protein
MTPMSVEGVATRLAVVGALVISSVLGPAPAAEALPHSLPSFNESPGCGARTGIRGPLVSAPGAIPDSEPIYGPWGDFYGRTVGSVREQLVRVRLPSPGGDRGVLVHERVLPALRQVLVSLDAERRKGNAYVITAQTYSFSPRTIPPGRAMSYHAIGGAIDVNAPANPYRADNILVTDMIDEEAEYPFWFVDAWRRAGWCWGGDWITIKDAMHFSWMGPAHARGYEMPPKQPPIVAPASFVNETILPVRLPAPHPAARHAVADLTGNGAPEVVRIQPDDDGRLVVVAATAASWYREARIMGHTATPPLDPEAPLALVDMNRNGRSDLVYVLDDEGTVRLEVFFLTGGIMPMRSIATSVPATDGAVYLFADHDRDGRQDLFVVRPGSPATLEVWSAPRFSSPVLTVELDGDAAGLRYALGDRTVDGLPDLFVLGPHGDLAIHTATSEYADTEVISARTPAGASLFVADLDGDGYGDLILVDAGGATIMRRGGLSTHDPGTWFVRADDDTPEPNGVRVEFL